MIGYNEWAGEDIAMAILMWTFVVALVAMMVGAFAAAVYFTVKYFRDQREEGES